ncbi:MAG: TRAP transporter permease [Rhizobiaceae bacterium]|nr:TRAP transporter permease [Rhizobiaceae bacterium]
MSAANANQKSAEEIAAEVDTGARELSGSLSKLIPALCLAWSLYQLYIASPIPSLLTEYTGLTWFYFIANLSISRKVHLAFGVVLVCLAYPLFKSSPRSRIPWYDWAMLIIGVACIGYMIALNSNIAERAGAFDHWLIPYDMTVALLGIAVLTMCVFRSLGLPMIIVAAVLAGYVFIGGGNWGGASFVKGMWHFWMQEEGIFGKPLEVSTQTIFLFVLFGAILEKAGAGQYFIKLAFALLGQFRGGPAKAAVLASAMSGMYSGSSIANTVTTGTFTIPLMKKTGFAPEKAGAVEVASSTNGQLTPPVMGAAAFLIAEFTGIQYTEILKHAIVPALVSYIALFYIVHLEACKMDLKGLEKPPSSVTFMMKAILFLTGFIGVAAIFGLVYFLQGVMTATVPGLSILGSVAMLLIGYLALIWFAAKKPDFEAEDPDAPILALPPAGETAIKGLYYLVPIILLMWCILPTPDRLSAHLSAFYACLMMIFIALTQHPLKAMMRGQANPGSTFRRGWDEMIDGMISGARNMIAIAIATAAAGIIIGSISITGAHQVVGQVVETLSGGNLMIMLILVAVMSLILGMGLPTTANYLVVSSLMAPVIVALGAKSGLIVPLIAVHLFVFYFGILADDTPPVGLAAIAAAAIAKGDPIKTGIQGFTYDIRTALLPFLFIFNTELLLIDVTLAKGIFVFIIAVIAMLLFAAATQGWWFTKNRAWETVALLLVAFTLFRPGYWLDQIYPPYNDTEPAKVFDVVGAMPDNGVLTFVVKGPDFDSGEMTQTTLLVPMGDRAEAVDRLRKAGLSVIVEDGLAKVEEPFPQTPFFETIGNLFDFYGDDPVVVDKVRTEATRPAKEWFYIPALLLLALVFFMQRRRIGSAPREAAIA